jgi:formiminoglutamase
MKHLEIYTQKDILQFTRKRSNETKFGEDVSIITDGKNWEKELKDSACRFVLLGIPEDIGVRANYGRGGAHTAWKPALESFLSQQSNTFLNAKQCLVLGHVYVDDLMERSNELTSKTKADIEGLRKLVAEVDARVTGVIFKIITANKTPIIIGGGHNNSYPIIKACSEALLKKINAINCDPHTDFRSMEGRHSGNGFSYAWQENYLNKYSVCCLHEQYNTASVLRDFTKYSGNLYFSSYEDVFVRENKSFSTALSQNIAFVKHESTGVEIDLDAITNVPSSAKTSSGISPVQARQYVYQCGHNLNALYLHIAEGAPILSHIKADNKTGKLIAYLISDFMKGILEKDHE